MSHLELWAGVECTVNRVDDRWRDQLERTGHHLREGDLERLAAMGAKAVRYPVLWERIAQSENTFDWTWTDGRLDGLRALGLRAIAGLVHHGSGPGFTQLTDAHFATKLAGFAREVARRYPWLTDFTPINEPLTTARFSGLYGLWYPHGRSSAMFARTLVEQCKAVAYAMRAVREVTPHARLIQTEDIGTVFSTPSLAYQAEFENERRWLSLDLLCGRVGRHHPMWDYLVASDIPPQELESFVEAPCPPDVIGLNYYVTSDRYLDERVDRYPPHTHGGNGRQAYADVEAVRVAEASIVGHCARLEEAWARYGLPLAFTEVHLGCSREEQLRWLRDAWRGAERACRNGVDVRAVTVWSAFGAVDWDSLLVLDRGHYEPGAYDVRAREPRATAIVKLARELGESGQGTHPVLAENGWWDSARRLTVPDPESKQGRPILITGATGALGNAIAAACTHRGLAHVRLSREELDITQESSIVQKIDELRPWAVINAAGYTRIDEAQGDSYQCHRANVWGPMALALACRERDIQFVTFSTDMVFDGSRSTPYVESDEVSPLSVYSWSKVCAERLVASDYEKSLIIRTSAFFGEVVETSFLHQALQALRLGQRFLAPKDWVTSPTHVFDLVHATLDLLIDGERGLWHLANEGAVNCVDLVRNAAEACRISSQSLVPCVVADLRFLAPRPRYTALASERASVMPALADAIERYARAWTAKSANLTP